MTQPDATLEPGRLLGDFELCERIGSGGFATVYRALHRRLERDVAIKVIRHAEHTDSADSAELVARRFLREVDLVRRLEHPNTVRLYDFGRSDDELWMAMELVRGESLASLLARERRLLPSRAVAVIMQALSALTEAHELGIIHRDLKPANIMLVRQGAHRDVTKVLDFGIAKAIGHGENPAVQEVTGESDSKYGTPRYMAPEQLKGGDVGPWTDVYATALVFFEMLTGRPAVEGDRVLEVLSRQLVKPLELPHWLARSTLATVLERAAAKQDFERYDTALAFFDAIAAVPRDELEHLDALALEDARAAGLELALGASSAEVALHVPGTASTSVLTRLSEAAVAARDQEAAESVPTGHRATTDTVAESPPRRRLALPLGLAAALALVVALVLLLRPAPPAAGRDEAPAAAEATTPAPAPVLAAEAAALPEAAAAPETPPVPLPPAPVEHRVEWLVHTTPAGAAVFVGDELGCEPTPCRVTLEPRDGDTRLSLRLPAHLDASIVVDARESGELTVPLRRASARTAEEPRPRAEVPRERVNPFGRVRVR